MEGEGVLVRSKGKRGGTFSLTCIFTTPDMNISLNSSTLVSISVTLAAFRPRMKRDADWMEATTPASIKRESHWKE